MHATLVVNSAAYSEEQFVDSNSAGHWAAHLAPHLGVLTGVFRPLVSNPFAQEQPQREARSTATELTSKPSTAAGRYSTQPLQQEKQADNLTTQVAHKPCLLWALNLAEFPTVSHRQEGVLCGLKSMATSRPDVDFPGQGLAWVETMPGKLSELAKSKRPVATFLAGFQTANNRIPAS